MPIEVDSRLRAAIRRNPGHIVLQVVGSSPLEATEALRRSRPLILQLDTSATAALAAGGTVKEGNRPKFVSEVIAAEPGPAIWIDGGHAPTRVLLRIPDVIREQLQLLGVTDAKIAVPHPHKLLARESGLFGLPAMASLRLYPDPPFLRVGVHARVPEEWIDIALRWLTSEIRAGPQLTAVTTVAEFPTTAQMARQFLEEWRNSQVAGAYIMAGRPPMEMAIVETGFQFGSLGLHIAGSDSGHDVFAGRVRALQEVARSVASQVALAVISIHPIVDGNLGTDPPTRLSSEPRPQGNGRYADRTVVNSLCDEAVFDAFFFQILGPGHLRRLEAARQPLAATLPGGRAELTIGDISDWLGDEKGLSQIRQAGRRALDPCLLSAREADNLVRERWLHQR